MTQIGHRETTKIISTLQGRLNEGLGSVGRAGVSIRANAALLDRNRRHGLELGTLIHQQVRMHQDSGIPWLEMASCQRAGCIDISTLGVMERDPPKWVQPRNGEGRREKGEGRTGECGDADGDPDMHTSSCANRIEYYMAGEHCKNSTISSRLR